jgi:hypothetical protein
MSTMARSRVIGVVAVFVLLLAVMAGNAGSQVPTPPIPPLPPKPPKLPKLPGQKKEKFKVIFEGTSEADRVADMGGPTGTCLAQLHADIHENVTFGRGKKLTIEVVRYKQGRHFGYLMQRTTGGSSFTVVGNVHRTAQGTAALLPNPPLSCPAAQSYDLSTNPDCGKAVVDRVDWGFKIKNDHFTVRPGAPDNFAGPSTCGEPPPSSAFGNAVGELYFQWPVPPQLVFEPLPLKKIFSTRRRAPFKVDFTSGRDPAEQIGKLGAPPLSGTFTDHGSMKATVRFIRIR